MVKLTLLLMLGVGLGLSQAQSCWWTGCQPSNWATVGCDQYNRDEKGRDPCENGFRYECCEKSGGGGGGDTGGGGGDGVPATATFDEFSKAVTSNGYPTPSIEQYNNFNRFSRELGKVSSKQELAMALAQMLHESDGLQAKREYACLEASNLNCPNNYRTPAECLASGQYYFGRGYIQLTWCENYRAASSALFSSDRLVRDPDDVGKDEGIAWQTACWFWADRVRNQPGVLEGKFGASTKAINGELECGAAEHTGPAKRFNIYGNVRSAFGLTGAGDSSGCR